MSGAVNPRAGVDQVVARYRFDFVPHFGHRLDDWAAFSQDVETRISEILE